MPSPILVSFVGGTSGSWLVDQVVPIAGEALPAAAFLDIREGPERACDRSHVSWVLRGTTSNPRYTERTELDALRTRQEAPGRAAATRAALIPIRKCDAWWDLAQDERRAIFEARSRHIAIGLDYLPEVARRLHHCRELGESFDFLTWFEFAPEHEPAFDRLLARLRATEEWAYVDREVEMRLTRI